MKMCICEDYQKNIGKINGIISLAAVRSGNPNHYDGKEFVFCPWCGKELFAAKESTNPPEWGSVFNLKEATKFKRVKNVMARNGAKVTEINVRHGFMWVSFENQGMCYGYDLNGNPQFSTNPNGELFIVKGKK